MKTRPIWMRTGNGGARIDTEQCCNGDCQQGDLCPRYRAANDESPTGMERVNALVEAAILGVLALLIIAALLAVWP